MRKTEFRHKLLSWYTTHQRDLPWRKTSDPYKIWVSEIILQQTRVSQGLAYYQRFIQQFPDVTSLAGTSSDRLMKVWEGLGYYSRARNMYAASGQVMSRYDGKMPVNYEELLTLKGIGPYTAAAISSIAGKEPHAVVDGNVYRVFTRFFGIYADNNRAGAMKKVETLAGTYLDPQSPGDYNQAVMELGALTCTPKRPDCLECPIAESCYAHQHGATDVLPSPVKKKMLPVRYFHYALLTLKDQVVVAQRTKQGIWHLLYEFPLFETVVPEPSPEEIINHFRDIFPGISTEPSFISETISHQLTHMRIQARFYHLSLDSPHPRPPSPYRFVSFSSLRDLPFPRIITRYLEKTEHNVQQSLKH